MAWLPLRFDANAVFQHEFCVFQASRLPLMASDRGKPFPADAFDFALSSRRFCKKHMRCIGAIKRGPLQLGSHGVRSLNPVLRSVAPGAASAESRHEDHKPQAARSIPVCPLEFATHHATVVVALKDRPWSIL